jgi:hypothetical protein
MKKSVNGKSFDEIFEQRGKEVNISDMIDNECYLIVQQGFDYNWIVIFDNIICKHSVASCTDVPTSACLASDDAYFDTNEKGSGFGLEYYSIRGVYEATPDQRELLNAYKNESK